MAFLDPVQPGVEGRRHVGMLPACHSQHQVVTMLTHFLSNQPPAIECSRQAPLHQVLHSLQPNSSIEGSCRGQW